MFPHRFKTLRPRIVAGLMFTKVFVGCFASLPFGLTCKVQMAEMIADRHKVRRVHSEKLGYCSNQYEQFQLRVV